MSRLSYILVFALLVNAELVAQSNSVLNTGVWYKVSVGANGIYKMDYNFLKNLGINPDKIDPQKIKLYSNSNGMLPQANSANRIVDLQELAIFVNGEGDGKFNTDDYVLFFGQGPDEISYQVKKDIFQYVNNIYSDKNFYFITVSDTPGKRLTTSENLPAQSNVVTQFDDVGYYETDTYNILTSGREWFGEQFDSKTEITIRFDFPAIVENSTIKFVSNVMAQAFDGASFNVFFNNNQIGTQTIDLIPNTSYGLKGREAADTLSFRASTVGAINQSSQDIKYQYVKISTNRSIGYLNYFLISLKRKLGLYAAQTIFQSAQSLASSIATYQLANIPEGGIIWDITDPFNNKLQNFSYTASISSFTTSSSSLKTFVAFKNEGISSPNAEGAVANQNLHALSGIDFLIITYPDFITEAQRLADHRALHDHLSVKVVTTEQIYNEYSGGKQDITALRDMIKDVYTRSNRQLANVLLFGRCSYNYKDVSANNTNFVPTYESVNSLSPLETYSSDDYFGFLKPNDGEWTEYPSLDHTMDIGVGRLSVKSLQESKDVVDKLIEYDNSTAVGTWNKLFVFVADDGDYNIHQGQADQLATSIETNHPEFDTKKIYLDAYKQITKPSGQYSPDTKTTIDKSVKSGAVLVNYTGHGSEQVWAQEQILDFDLVAGWKNAPKYPLFVTATCEFGRHDNPSLISSGEQIQLQPKGGGIGLVTTARPVNSSTNFTLNQAFYDALFTKSNGAYRSLGTIFKDTKNNSLSGVSNRNFSLLGDPSMKLAFGQNQVAINSLKTINKSDTLKALSTVQLKGVIKSGQQASTDFSGDIEITLFDKVDSLVTLGDENPIFPYTARDNSLFRGKATIEQGNFQIEFTIPKNIQNTIGNAKVSLFASNSSGQTAIGGSSKIKIGLTETSTLADTNPPTIKLFMGDTSYVTGGLVGPNSTLIARLQDASGINISNRIKSKSIQITLDDTLTYVANDFYEADKNTFTQGTVSFPFMGLTKGSHHISLSASDIYNNTSSSRIDFNVTDGNGIVVDQFYNYPNPFNAQNETFIQFVHSRPGEDLEATLEIFDTTGQLQDSRRFSIDASPYRVILTTWDGTGLNGNKLGSGVYFARLSVRSMLDGSKNDQSTKLIILN